MDTETKTITIIDVSLGKLLEIINEYAKSCGHHDKISLHIDSGIYNGTLLYIESEFVLEEDNNGVSTEWGWGNRLFQTDLEEILCELMCKGKLPVSDVRVSW